MEVLIFLVLFFLVGAFILQGLRRIPADPPHKAVLTIFGKRTGTVKDEGWRFFPLYPFWYGAILVDVAQKNLDLKPQVVRTPELGEIEIWVSITWRPDYGPTEPKDPDRNHLIKYLNVRAKEGVEDILTDIVQEKIREFAMHNVTSWEGLLRIKEDLVAIIVAAIMGEDWQALREEQKTKITNSLRKGDGVVRIGNLGIILSRLNVTDIKPRGQLAEVAELEAKGRQERRGELFEAGTDFIKAQQLVEAAKKQGEELTLEQAFQIMMEWKATREGRGFVIPGLAPSVKALLSSILGEKAGDTKG